MPVSVDVERLVFVAVTVSNRPWLLSRLNYEAMVTMNEIPAHNQAVGWARALLNMFVLAGVILAFCVVSGLLFGAWRVLSKRWAPAGSDEAMIRLHLEGK